MKYVLAGSQFTCLLALVFSGSLPRYRWFALYLLVCLPATLAFHAEGHWLRSVYAWMALPLVLLRLGSGIEVLHRQTEGFRYWWRLTGCAFLVAGCFAGAGWIRSAHPDFLRSVVELRRLIQIFLAGIFLYVENFWITQGGGWYRKTDHLAVLFGVCALNHGLVSFVSGVVDWDEGWKSAALWSSAIDALVYLGMALRFLSAPSVRIYP